MLFITVLILLALFSFVLLFGPPYLPTLSKQIEETLKLTGLKPGQTLLELGSGDGRVLLVAAKRGIRGVGYELNPLLVIVSRIVTFKYRKKVKIIWGNYWLADWPEADVMYVFLLQRFMAKLDKKIVQQDCKVTLVSFASTIPGKKPTIKKAGLFLYEYK
jgi:hypothetical protein